MRYLHIFYLALMPLNPCLANLKTEKNGQTAAREGKQILYFSFRPKLLTRDIDRRAHLARSDGEM